MSEITAPPFEVRAMFSALKIKNFRGFREFKIDGLGRVNLIAGANGVGKTSLLEALYLLLGETNVQLVLNTSAFRGFQSALGEPDEIAQWVWAPLFFDLAATKTIEISAKRVREVPCQLQIREMARESAQLHLASEGNGKTSSSLNGLSSRKLVFEYRTGKRPRTAALLIDRQSFRIEPPQPPSAVKAFFLASRAGNLAAAEDARLFDQFEVAKQSLDILPALQVLEPRLISLRTITGAGGTLLFGDIGLKHLIPLGLLGEGINRLISLLLRIATAANGIVLVDEIEDGLHYSVMPKVWEALAKAVHHFKTQVFCTTHSWECVWAAHRAFQENRPYDLCYFRLDNLDGTIVAKQLDEEMLDVVGHTDLEIR